MICATDLHVTKGAHQVLDDVLLEVPDGRIIGLVGPNGAGKSTLLSTLYRALAPSSGIVTIDGIDVARLHRNEIARRVSVVAQRSETVMALPVRDAVALGRIVQRSMLDYGRGDDSALISHALKQVGMDRRADRLTTELSGGELQRVLIARAIVQQASHLLLDEPTNHLDIHHQYAVLELVRELQCTTVAVLHDLNLAAQFCDEIVLLCGGRVVATGSPFDVLTPERVSAAYNVTADIVEHSGLRHLVFRPTVPPRSPR